jgi:gluconate 2-dehydrogenase gamma chain
MTTFSRRQFVATVGAATVAPISAWLAGQPVSAAPRTMALQEMADEAAPADPVMPDYLFFDPAEAAFIEAACERLIPADESGPGATGAGVAHYLDRQLGGAWGSGERLYRSGPWQAGSPSQGYRVPFTPAVLFHKALRAINRDLESEGAAFAALGSEAQDAYLKSLEAGGWDLDGVPSAVFFDMLLKMSVEAFFSDPVYGGNRDRVAWPMVGFPGAYADYYEASRQSRSQPCGR